jgi:hypothetical protein
VPASDYAFNEDTGRTRIGPSIGWGLLAFFGLPILAIVALVTIVGIPLGIGVLTALALIYTLGYTATAWIIGRRILSTRTTWVVASCWDGASCGSWP